MSGSAAAAGKCAICGKPQDAKYRPFCSKRCADVDLNRWLSGAYAIAAAEEAKAPVIWYPMKSDGVQTVDGIGATFNQLTQAISGGATSGSASKAIRVRGLVNLASGKASLYFVHDLVLFAGPITHAELIDFLIVAFGKNNYDALKQLLGILRSAGLIHCYEISGTWVYKSALAKPFLRYPSIVGSLMASFRCFHLRTDPNRFAHA